MKRLAPIILLFAAALPALGQTIDEAKLIDLSYSFGPNTIYWPTAKSFDLTAVAHGRTEGGYWYAANNFAAAEHGGTHTDAPIHFAEGGVSVDQLPLGAGIGPLVRVDVSGKAALDGDYRLTVADLQDWEKQYGRIPRGAIVVMYSGWGTRWPDRRRYLGTDVPGDTANLHFPGFSKEGVEFLVKEREIDAIGVDTASVDYGPSKDFEVHQVMGAANKPGFENLANLDRIPPKGATLIALPMKIAGGTGGPTRAIALLP